MLSSKIDGRSEEKKAAQLALWKQTLSADERIVLDAALCAYST
jgi:hypothetical protein